MSYKIAFISDLHGNEIQFKKIANYMKSNHIDSLIIGGDLSPKNFGNEMIERQAEFLETKLPKLLEPLRQLSPESKLFIMGNDDCKVNLPILEKHNHDLFEMIHGTRIDIADFEIIGYGYVPITPFGLKDWEKYDLSKPPKKYEARYANRKQNTYRLNGVISTNQGFESFRFTSQREKEDSIQKDFNTSLFTKKPKKTIYVIHTPPDNTNLDVAYVHNTKDSDSLETMVIEPESELIFPNSQHVGSIAIRKFIEEYQPYLTLHGHIHETVDITGHFKHKIGSTVCLSPGNNDRSENLAIIILDLYHPSRAKRLII
ncbi:MAG: metallophosphoesterase family protein [Candidatus Woesearchaeota archaeon]